MPNPDPACMKLPVVEGMWNGFDFDFFLDRIYRIDGILFACGEMPSAEGRSIQAILLILSNCYLKIRIHSLVKTRNVQSIFSTDYLNIFAVYQPMYFSRELFTEIFLQQPAYGRDFIDIDPGFDSHLSRHECHVLG